MTMARSHKIDLQATPFYHCMSRCVRCSFLCGVGTETGQDYLHRKDLIVKRIKHLAIIFAIQVCAYAVMSNHYQDNEAYLGYRQIFENSKIICCISSLFSGRTGFFSYDRYVKLYADL